ncbi:hypothetical protein GH714_032298 [Hevea brasiliensis]|uniref:FHA domain-containing protein n=1 Tax=Hevea brasiliensis TaxID=3981 RepID=A0A6A6L6H2_HEVBR|nr:hypothetical protein GH714_032298 [Hevea brasiliensis]
MGKGSCDLAWRFSPCHAAKYGSGGCMAIEDSYQLALELDKAWKQSIESGTPIDVVSSLKSYEIARRLRVSIIHGMARMAAIMASTYKAYLGVGLGPLSASDQLRTWFENDDALERALNGEWFLLPCGNDDVVSEPICLSRDENAPCMVGNVSLEDFPGRSIVLPLSQVSNMHAHISYKDGAFYLIDLGSKHGTFITHNEGRRHRVPPNFPTRFHPSDVIEFGSDEKKNLTFTMWTSWVFGSGDITVEKTERGESPCPYEGRFINTMDVHTP